MTDWTATLATFIQSRLTTPFQWGESDCALLLADWVQTRTGTDFAAPFRGRYKTAVGSKRALKRQGFACLEEAIRKALGEPLDSPMLAQRGDGVLVATPDGPAAGIVCAAGVVVQGETGLVTMPLSQAISAWRVR